MKQIYIVRHCNASGQDKSAGLTEEGIRQSEELDQFFSNKNIEYIVSSPFERAISSILPFSDRMGLEIHIDDRLRERELSSIDLDDWMAQLKETFHNLDLKLPGGESSQEAMDRGVQVIKEMLEREEKNIIVVTHGNLMSLILKYYDGNIGFEDWRALSNPDVFALQKSEKSGEIRIKRMWEATQGNRQQIITPQSSIEFNGF